MRSPIAGQNILVTGGAGFIGSHLVDELLSRGAEQLIIVDNLFCGSLENLSHLKEDPRVTLYRDDASECGLLGTLIQRHQISTTFNCATKALNYSFINPFGAFETNTKVLGNLLEFLRQGAFKSLCHFSTSEVFGTAQSEFMDEKHPIKPTTTYASGKAAADLLLKSYVQMFAVDAFIVRPFNGFGPRQNWEDPLAAVIPRTARLILEGRKPEIHGTGEQERDFTYVRDTVRDVCDLFRVMNRGEEVNISSESRVSIRAIVQAVASALDYHGEFSELPARGADVLSHCGSSAFLKTKIPYVRRPFPEALAETVDWYRQKRALSR